MTQDERWLANYNEVVEFVESNRRNPSKHRIEEHDMLNWCKANRKALNAGKMKAEREYTCTLSPTTVIMIPITGFASSPSMKM